jgi:hypothetical protein
LCVMQLILAKFLCAAPSNGRRCRGIWGDQQEIIRGLSSRKQSSRSPRISIDLSNMNIQSRRQ